MGEHPLRRILSKILRGGETPGNFELAYVHRGGPDDTMKIKVSQISHVGKGSFLLEDGETQIPFHRVLYVTDEKQNLVLWQKRARTET